MTTNTARALLGLAFALAFTNVSTAAPRVQSVELKPFTQVVVQLPPGLGTKFTFPFVIAEGQTGKDFPPFSKFITNERFKSPKVAEATAQLNSFIVYAPLDLRPGERGMLFFNIAGYEVTVELIGTHDIGQHVSDVNFKLGKERREELVQEIVAQRTRRLEEEHKERLTQLDADVDRRALARVGELALTRPGSRRVKEEATTQLKNGDKVKVVVDEMLTYGAYTLIPFDIELNSRGAGVPLRGAGLFARAKGTPQFRPVTAGTNLPASVEPNRRVRGVLTALTKEIDPDELLKVSIQVDDATVEVQW